MGRLTSRILPERVRERLLGRFIRHFAPFLYVAAFVWRRLLRGTTFVAVTGAVGKTTTKELVAAVLATRGRTLRTWRNQNAGPWISLNVLRARPWHRFVVLELAAAAPGTMKRRADLVGPDVAVVLSVVPTHTSAYRDLDEHAAEKARLLDALRPGGVAVLNGDDPRVAAMAGRARGHVVLFGGDPSATLRAEAATSVWPARLRLRVLDGDANCEIRTRLVGTHWTTAVLAAVAVGRCVGIPLADAARAVALVEPFPARLEPVRLPNGAVVLRDDYNASVQVLEASLRVLESAEAARRILVLTDFSDLRESRKGRLRFLASRLPPAVDVFVVIGEACEWGRRRAIEAGLAPDAVHAVETLREATVLLREMLGSGDLVLLKGRTTDHTARILFGLVGEVECWKRHCRKTTLCDVCWELGSSTGADLLATVPPPE